jgi:hypothetical protein
MGVLTAERPATAPSRRETMLIGNERGPAADGRTFFVETPARRDSAIAEVPRASAADVDRAVKAAAKAFETWRTTHWKDRARALYRIADAVGLLGQDGFTARRARWKLYSYLWRKPGLMRRIVFQWAKILLPGFHPWKLDNRHLIRKYESDYADARMLAE